MDIGELKKLLENHGLRPIKGRSQNFLLDDSVVAKTVEAAGVAEGSRVLEIGPGPGVLTAALLEKGSRVLAVEIDPGMCRLLRERFGEQLSGPEPQLQLIEGDVLRLNNRQLADLLTAAGNAGEETPSGEWQVVANLPYAITSAVLEKFLFGQPRPKSLTLMLQKEVAQRLTAEPRKMSSIAVACQTLAEPWIVTKVLPDSFYPPPKVDSAVIHIRMKNDQERRDFFQAVSPEKYFRVVRTAFSQKRKQLKNTLSALPGFKELDKDSLNEAKISLSMRPEELRPEQWQKLTEAFRD